MDIEKLVQTFKVAEQDLAVARGALAGGAQGGIGWEELNRRMLQVAERTGARDALAIMGRYSKTSGVDAGLHATVEIMFNGPDDTWSGRGNDARRAYHDGFRSAVGAIWTEFQRR